jgi:hypothetical protein
MSNYTYADHLKKLNGMMDSASFISGAAGEEAFRTLLTAISAISRGSDRYALPQQSEMHAWKKAWTIYQKLVDRENLPPDPVRLSNAIQEQQREAKWNAYLTAREALLAQSRHGGFTDAAAEYLGLHKGDLLSPVLPPDPNRKGDGRRANWPVIADRLDCALQTWRDLGPQQKRDIPSVMAARHAESALAAMQERFEDIESRLSTLEGVGEREKAA